MPSVVIIHAAEDALPARALAEKLRAARLTPVIEQAPGEALRQAVRDAAVTIALWSPRSVGQAALVEETSYAKSKSRLVHARMQNAANPDPFGADPSIDLTGWRGEDEFPGWRELARTVAEKAGVPAPPAPAPGPHGPAGFFQPGAAPGAIAAAPRAPQAPQAQQQGRPAPQPAARPPAPAPRAIPREAPEEPRKGGAMMMGLIALAVVAVGAGGYFAWTNMQGSQAAGAAWENVQQNDASALRAFIAGEPGSFRDEAETALAALEEQTFDAAREEDSIQAFEGFLIDFPDSDHAIEARGRIAELQSMPTEGEIQPETALSPDPAAPAPDPDLVPPNAATSDPTGPGGPATLTPPAPAPETPLEEPAPELPTN